MRSQALYTRKRFSYSASFPSALPTELTGPWPTDEIQPRHPLVHDSTREAPLKLDWEWHKKLHSDNYSDRWKPVA